IYALGAVLYEMLTGDPPYTGSTAQAVLGKIIQGVPVSATAVRKSIPANVDAAIRKALEKLPADRFTGADDFAKALGNPSFRHGADPDAVVAGAGAGPWKISTLAASAAALVLAGTTFNAVNRPEPVRPVERFGVPFLEGQEPVYIASAGFDLSPNGSMLVYRHNPGTGQVLFVRRWDDLRATPVRDTEEASDPAVSHDGLELAFSQGGEIRVLALAGGPVRTLMQAELPEWGRDGFVYGSTDSGLVRVPRTGGAVETVSRLEAGDENHIFGDVLPDQRGAL
ncbi:MAG: hypothetical protein GWM88_06015, partial [Pseudomonadales bacterium]|nr:hypothetical protein [Pseudomonadales bacterium]NIX07581.1 hypothetical protein [Pseudomonadales bacterium]